MDKRTKKLIGLAAVFVLLLGAYFATLDIRPAPYLFADEPPELPNLIERDEGVRVMAFHMDNGYDLSFIRYLDGETEVGVWRLDDKRDLRLDQIAVATVAFSVTTLPYHGTISLADIAGDLELYGLGESAIRVSVDYSDGSSEVLYVGSETPDGRFFFAMLEESENIYLIDARVGRRMSHGHNQFMDRNLPRPNVVSLAAMEFLIDGDEFAFELAPPGGVEHFGWMRDEFISRGVGAGKRLDMAFAFGALFEGLPNLRLTGVIINPDEDLSVYGLAEPPFMMSVIDGDGVVLRFYAGYETEDGQRYLKHAGERFVYTIDSGVIERLESVNRSRLFQRRITDVVIAQADTVRVSGGGRNVTLRPNSVDADGSAYRRIFETRWDSYIDPFDVSGIPAVWTLQINGHIAEENIIERQLETITEGNFTRQPDGSIRYSLTYTFHVFDDLFYAISRDGEPAVTAISRTVLDRVFGGL